MSKAKSALRELIETVVSAGIIAFFIITFIAQAHVVPTGSMIPTLKPGDRIMVNKFIYHFHEPRRGDIVVFHYPENPKERYVKRLIALEGERLEIKDNRIFINGKKLNEPYLEAPTIGDYGPVKIEKNHLFMMGDNRNNSNDSRYWGQLPRKNVIGKAMFIFWPFNRMTIFK